MVDRFVLALVDDEPGITRSLEREIRLEFGHEAFEIVTFNNPVEALSWISDHRDEVFLVIADLRMPEMNGSDLLVRIRAFSADIQTILLTAYTDIDSIQRAVSATILSLMFKPWKRGELVTEIDRALRIRKSARDNAVLKARIDGMLSSTGEFQRSLFSREPPQSPRLSWSVSFNPLETYHCGGDFYEIDRIDGDRYLLVLGDVTGHGPKSAAIACMLKVALRASLERAPYLRVAPDLLLAELNDLFCDLLEPTPEILLPMHVAFVDPAARTVALASAGMPPAILARKGIPRLIPCANPVPGAFKTSEYAKVELALEPGDRLIFYTDGIAESAPAFFSREGDDFLTHVTSRADYSAEALLASFRDAIPDCRFSDDVTIVSMLFEG